MDSQHNTAPMSDTDSAPLSNTPSTDIDTYIKETAPRNSPTVRWWVIIVGVFLLILGICAFYDFYLIKQVDSHSSTSDSSGVLLSPLFHALGELSYQPWMFYSSFLLTLLGLYCIFTALRPRPGIYLPTAAPTALWLRPLDVARIASHHAKQVPGVIHAQSIASTKKITVTISTIAPESANFNPEVTLPDDIPQAVIEHITQALSSLHTLPEIRVIDRSPTSASSPTIESSSL